MKWFRLLLLCLIPCLQARSQDGHFSQFYEMPVLLNPARTGFFSENYRLAGIYRSQWKEITLPFKTLSGTIDLNVPTGKNKNNIIGIAIMDFADKAGDANYTTNYIEACLSFHKNFGENFSHYIGIGLMGGFASTSFELDKLYFDEDYGTGTNTEIPAVTSSNYADLSIGSEYNFINEETHFNVGLAIYHFNQPNVTYFNNGESVVYRKYVANAGLSKTLSTMLEIQPRLLFVQQGSLHEIQFGTDLKIILSKSNMSDYAITFGGYYRVGDAIIPKFRLDMGDLSFGLSYDFSTSSLAKVSQLSGGPELSVTFLGSIKGVSAGRVYNPRF